MKRRERTSNHLIKCSRNYCDMASEKGIEYKYENEDKDSKIVPENIGCAGNCSPVNVFEESGDSEYDTDLEICPSKESIDEDTEYEDDAFICRRRYLNACVKCDDVTPQSRMIKEMETTTVNLSKRSLGPALVKPICIGLVDNLRVENLILDGVDLGDLGGQYISQLLLDNMVITRLNISGNNLSDDAARHLSVALATTKTLQHLNLSDNKFGDVSATFLAKGIAKNKSLAMLNLSKNHFAEESGTLIGGALAENERLEYLDLSWNLIRQKGAVGIFKGVTVNTGLRSLIISWNGLGYEGSVAISKSLKENTTLVELDISNNRINWDGAVNIAKGLKKNGSLHVLKIGNNPLTTTGAMDIVQAVSETTSGLRELDLMNVSVLGETELLAVTIERIRKFKLIHGGVVRTSDKLGERKEREVASIERVMEYMKRLGIRPVELLRAFDKNVMFNVTQAEFVRRLKKSGIQLHTFEMEALAKSIAGRDLNGRSISYNKFVDAVNAQILKERNYRIKKRKEKEKLIQYHKKIMSVQIATDTGSEDDDGDFKSLHSSSRTSLHTALSIPTQVNKLPPLPLSEKDQPCARKPVKVLSLCGPLDKTTKIAKPKKSKKKRRKKQPEIKSWMSTSTT